MTKTMQIQNKTWQITWAFGLLIAMLLTLSSCEDYFDINEDPNNPTAAQLNQLLTNSQVAIAGSVGMSTGGLTSHLGVFMHQITRRGEPDRYGTLGNGFMVNNAWQQFYDIALQDLRVLIEDGTEQGNMIYVGIAKLMKAYSYSVLVDVWGDVPFSEANRFPEIQFPVFDDDAQIYQQLFSMIDEAVADLQNSDATNILTPGADDLIYGGSVSNWIRFANTLKLKLYNQVRMVNEFPDAEQQIVNLIAEDNLISSASQDFEVWYGNSVSPDNRHPAFIADYANLNKTYYISIWFYNILIGQNQDILTGTVDPRLPYYFHNQLVPGEAAQNPSEFLDPNGFLSIHFGSSHPNQAQNQNTSQTVLGLYPAGGWFDDGSGSSVSATTGTGVAPERMLNHYTRLFIEAELALDGVIEADPAEKLTEAIQASFDKVNQVVTTTGTTQAVPTLTQDTIDWYINRILLDFENAELDKKLEIILTQKWIASFGNSVDQYNDYRRRDYPVLFDPSTDTGPFAQFTSSSRTFLLSLPWRADDLTLNPNSPSQKIPTQDGVFWDPN